MKNDPNSPLPREDPDSSSPRPRHISTFVIAVLTLLLVVLIVVFILSSDKHQRKVRVLYPKIIASLPHFVAKRQGLYKKYHLIVDASPIGKSSDMVEAVRMGNCDFLPAVSLVDAVNISLGTDAPVLTIMSHSRMKKDVPFDCLLVTPGSRVESLKDLEGRKVGVFPGGTSEASIKWYLGGLGIDTSKVTFRASPPREQIDMLLAGVVDV